MNKIALLLSIMCLSQLAEAQGIPAQFRVTQYNVGNYFAVPRDINENGDMLGVLKNTSGSYERAILRPNGNFTILQNIPGWSVVIPVALNENGEAVGTGIPDSSRSGNSRTLKWNAAGEVSILDIATDPTIVFTGPTDAGYSINNSGEIAGAWREMSGPFERYHTVTWDAATGAATTIAPYGIPLKITDSGNLFTKYGVARDENGWHAFPTQLHEDLIFGLGASEHFVVGEASAGIYGTRYFLGDYAGHRIVNIQSSSTIADNAEVNDLGIVTLDNYYDIDNDPSNNNDYTQTKIWSMATGIIDLTSLLEPGSGLTITNIYNINNKNQMVGKAKDTVGNIKYIRLDPVPEPASLIAIAIGLAGLGKRKR